MRPAVVVIAVSCLVIAAALARQGAPVVDNAQAEDASEEGAVFGLDFIDETASAIDGANPFALMDQATISADVEDANVRAFLLMIQHSEGTDQVSDPYACLYGYSGTITDFSDHPKLTGEWQGVSLANLGPSYAGKISTAAGAYQIIKPTWQGCKRALGLTDFGPASQDAAAIYLIREAGALDYVKAGQFDAAVGLCAREWASLPGANAAGQAMRRLDDLRTAYANAGGAIA